MEYYSDNAKKALESRKANAEALADAWARVERVHKKDGGDFANLSQNFKNCTIKMQEWSHNREEKEIKVYTTDANGRSLSDELNLARTLERNEEEKAKEEGREIIERGAYLKPFYVLNTAEIEELCKNRANYYKEEAEEMARTLENFDKVAGELVALREQAKKTAKACGTYSAWILESIFKESRL